MKTSLMDIFIGECDGRDFAYALSHDEAVRTVERSWAFGDPLESEMAICDVWASSQSERGWKIRKMRMEVTHIPVVINAAPGTTGHVIWTCWECGKASAMTGMMTINCRCFCRVAAISDQSTLLGMFKRRKPVK